MLFPIVEKAVGCQFFRESPPPLRRIVMHPIVIDYCDAVPLESSFRQTETYIYNASEFSGACPYRGPPYVDAGDDPAVPAI